MNLRELLGYYSRPRLREMAFLSWPLLSFRLSAQREILRLLARERPRELLEVGMGMGGLSRRMALLLPEAEILSIDSSPEMVRAARSRPHPPNLRFRLGSFWDAPRREGVVIFHAFVLFSSLEGALSRLREITGRFALVTLTAPCAFTKAHRIFHRALSGLDVHLVEPQTFVRKAKPLFDVSWVPIHPGEMSYLAILR